MNVQKAVDGWRMKLHQAVRWTAIRKECGGLFLPSHGAHMHMTSCNYSKLQLKCICALPFPTTLPPEASFDL